MGRKVLEDFSGGEFSGGGFSGSDFPWGVLFLQLFVMYVYIVFVAVCFCSSMSIIRYRPLHTPHAFGLRTLVGTG